MVGSRDYFSTEVEGNFNITLANRQPGSSIKPFIYATAFKKGYLPSTVLFDVKTQFSTNCEPSDLSSNDNCYSPNNHDNKFAGPISMRNALAQSLNIPAVKTLYLAGIHDSLKTAADMGITTLNDPDRYGLTLVLGGGEVKLLDMTNAYSVFANKGVKAEPHSILKIEDAQGNTLEDNTQIKNTRVLDENITNMISDILSDDAARAPLWGRGSVVYFANYDVAVKSGSTNDFRDAWIMGYAPNLAVGAWCGNNDNAVMKGLSGLITTPMWRAFMDYALAKLPKESFTQPYIPSNVKPFIAGSYVNAQDLLDTVNSTSSDKQIKLSDLYNSIHSELYYINRLDPLGPPPNNPNSDGQFKYWEYGVERWKEQTLGALVGSSTPIDISTSSEPNTPSTPSAEVTPESSRNN
jgi:membrane peptidoglycan carboxypeptidase